MYHPDESFIDNLLYKIEGTFDSWICTKKPPSLRAMDTHRAMFKYYRIISYYQTDSCTIITFDDLRKAYIPYGKKDELFSYIKSLNISNLKEVLICLKLIK